MKRYVATRKLKRKCLHCNSEFSKGDIYYKKREVFAGFAYGKQFVHAFENLICPKCKYKQESQSMRFEKFKNNCHHPNKFITEIWRYIPGECVMEPDYSKCSLCGEIVT